MPPRSLPDRRTALTTCAFAALTALVCACLIGAAALMPAPPAVVPLIALVCIGCPILASWQLPDSLVALTRGGARDPIAELRSSLDELPETSHPLGL